MLYGKNRLIYLIYLIFIAMATTNNQLSQKALESLKELKEWRDEPTATGGQFINLADGQTKTLLFDTDDMVVQTVTFPDKPEKPVKRAKYGVFDITEKSYEKQYLTAGKNLSLAVDSNLEEGNVCLKITRTGQKFDTKYSVVATQIPNYYQVK